MLLPLRFELKGLFNNAWYESGQDCKTLCWELYTCYCWYSIYIFLHDDKMWDEQMVSDSKFPPPWLRLCERSENQSTFASSSSQLLMDLES